MPNHGNRNQRPFAVVSALAASALPSLVLARGHRIEQIEEVPLVVASAAKSFTKTKEAVALLKSLNAYTETPPAPRPPHKENNNIIKVFCNFLGVELVNVRRLNLLQLAPGGHLGSFIIWTKGAFMLLDEVFGTFDKVSTEPCTPAAPSLTIPMDETKCNNARGSGLRNANHEFTHAKRLPLQALRAHWAASDGNTKKHSPSVLSGVWAATSVSRTISQ
ncbi:ribosomal protein L4 domain-containing protein [Mycena latifolia]|nr:ribosomal protein L4 domain-containing protein [Mycena latifolia]